MARHKLSSWWGGLYRRLLRRGWGAGAAKLAARHVRSDLKPYAERFFSDPRVAGTEAADAFEEIFLA